MQTDYLVKGCGASAMAFVDTMLKETDATFTIVDKRAAPGGHWNDAYPFVRLHQPSASYGVPSRPLGHMRKDTMGFNRGYYELASGIEVTDHFHQVMRDVFLPSGRVNYHPVSEVTSDENSIKGEFVSLLSGDRHQVGINKKFVDATALQTSIPLTHTRKFEVADGVTCIPPNDLTRVAAKHKHFTVLGAGKTAIDSVLWLLANGANPAAVTWVVPRDPWLVNRAHFQPGDEFFESSIAALAEQNVAVAAATTVRDLCERLEAQGIWLRINPTVWPTMMHGATVNDAELTRLRQVGRFVRGQRVRRLESTRMVLDNEAVAADASQLYVDCTARALAANVHDYRPVFESRIIRLQMIRQFQPTFSAALIGHIEASVMDEVEKQRLAQVAPMTDTAEDWVTMMIASMTNQGNWSANKEIVNWIANCRLDLFSGQARRLKPEDTSKLAALVRMRELGGPALRNLHKLAKGG
ncbi:MAG TPA: hypothetical protein VK629_01340 [Steroidobacteraceae bacterium]|nr:hypothetical protein [Steroidobacteraceae bacterium]